MATGRKSRINKDEYREPLNQRWIKNTYAGCYTDQYGFRIDYGERYTLHWKDVELVKTFSLTAAKEISTILINDKIMHEPK